jgi:tRNA (adenine-N(1)-)-methyltransferase non-catalytic subunit
VSFLTVLAANVLAKKTSRYSKIFSTIEATLFNVCEYWFVKDQNRIRDLRVDSLSQMLNLANVRPGGRYLAVDDASGLLVASILERLGGMSLVESRTSPTFMLVRR